MLSGFQPLCEKLAGFQPLVWQTLESVDPRSQVQGPLGYFGHVEGNLGPCGGVAGDVMWLGTLLCLLQIVGLSC